MGYNYDSFSSDTTIHPSDYPDLLQRFSDDEARASLLRDMIVDYTTNGFAEEADYRVLRDYFLKHDDYSPLLPKFVTTYRSLAACWEYLKVRYLTYLERKIFVHTVFEPMLRYVNSKPLLADLPSLPEAAPKADSEKTKWARAYEKTLLNPEGAITLAIINLENTCRAILNQLGSEVDTSDFGLYGLYQETVKGLKLFQRHHNDVAFKAMLSGLSEIISGLDLFNSQLSDGASSRVNTAQAELAVSTAESIANFLLKDYREHTGSSPS